MLVLLHFQLKRLLFQENRDLKQSLDHKDEGTYHFLRQFLCLSEAFTLENITRKFKL